MHSTMKVTWSNRSRRSLFLVLLMAALTMVVHGQGQNATDSPGTSMPPGDEPASEPPASEPPASEPPASEPPASEPPTSEPPVPTDPPTMVETDEPTMAPVATDEPTTAPVTRPPTAAPLVTDAPTATTDSPTAEPTVAPTVEPTLDPTAGTGTDAPVEGPPTAAPSTGTRPSSGTQPSTKFQSLEMIMTGVDPLNNASFQVWSKALEDWYADFYDDHPGKGISEVSSIITFVSQDPPGTQRRGLGEARNLQNQELKMVYDQTISFQNSSDSNLDAGGVITEPLASESDQKQFAERLKATGNNAFADITSVSGVSQEGQGQAQADDGLSTAAIVGIAVGGAAGLVLLGGAGYWATHSGDGGYEKNIGDHPPSSLQLGGGDDVSTLNDPTKSLRAADSAGGYGDQSVGTMDYDYSKAYGGGADSSVVSSVGGTLGSQTQATAAGAGTVEGSYSEDFDVAYQDPNTTVKEIALEVWAPPGKLGVVIDTPNDGAPVVHAIKESSVIADKLQVGDLLLAVDDENVTAMTAIKVSKLISRKSANPTRKLSILRRVVE